MASELLDTNKFENCRTAHFNGRHNNRQADNLTVSGIGFEHVMPDRSILKMLRGGSALVILGSLLNLAHLFGSQGFRLSWESGSTIVNLAVGAFGLGLSFTSRFARIWRVTTWGLLALLIANATALGTMGGRPLMLFVSLLMIMIGTGALLPWSFRFQLSLNLLCLAS